MLSRKGVYPYEFMDDWEECNETSLPEKEEFCCNLKMKDYNTRLQSSERYL